MVAPLFGGPSMLPSEDIEPIALYKGFTKKTKFLVEEELAQKTLIGNIAVAKKSMGKGHLYIFGPHFEHPHYPTCNLFLAEIIRSHPSGRPHAIQKDFLGNPVKREALRNLLRDFKRELSNSRIMVSGMNDFSLNWLIGNKYYEPGKFQLFLEAVWRRLKYLETGKEADLGRIDPNEMISLLKGMTHILRKMKKGIDRGEATNGLAEDLFPNLKKVASDFLTIYFRTKRMESIRA
jgi:hypothetical protein